MISVHIDTDKCEGHGLCVQLAPEIFDLSDDEIAFCTTSPNAGQLSVVNAAAAACPRQAITVARTDTTLQE
jgi:ferredoxin